MRLGFFGGILAVLIVAALTVAYSSLFTVYQTQQALVVRLGQPVRAVHVATVLVAFQRFPITPGNSMRHEHDMDELCRPRPADFQDAFQTHSGRQVAT
jgi:regulator of protease activity HflC (stomatin/prohibitin superfamily)